MISLDSAAPDPHGDLLCVHVFGARPPADRPFRRTRRAHRGTRSLTARARRQAISDARIGGEIARDLESGSVSSFEVSSTPNVDTDINCDSLSTSARLFQNKPSLHTEIVPVNVPPIVASAAAPNGDGLDHNGVSPGRVRGQPRTLTPGASDSFTVLSFNPQGMRDAIAIGRVDALVVNAGSPSLVAISESWLDNTLMHISLSGYRCVSRLDRRQGIRTDRGGIALFARDGFATSVVHIADSELDERSWYVIHANCGPVVFCLWYRPPHIGEIASIHRFEQEFARYSRLGVSSLVVGDMNVHNVGWLRFSRRDSTEGRLLEEVCSTLGFKQHVKGPTRGAYLLDLVLSDFASGVRCKVVPGIHEEDHDAVLTTVDISVAESEPVKRKVYDFKKAEWEKLNKRLGAQNWEFLHTLSADNATARLTSVILECVSQCIPQRWIVDKAFVHPWIDDTCKNALARKQAARGTEDFLLRRDECSTAFLFAYHRYVAKTRDKLKSMSASSRGWWRLSSTLLTKAGARENIPPLEKPDGSWAINAADKADELARVFRSKAELPPRETNEYSDLGPPQPHAQGFLRLRVRAVRRILKKLDEHSGTGPDHLPSRILKRCASVLAWPVTLLARKLLREHRWPECWRTHWIHGIFKKGSRADGRNYRGVHLTSQLSKVLERAIGSLFIPYLEATEAYGPHQYAYGKGRGYQDVLLINICQWLLLLETGHMVGVYCSDVSGAFDKVSMERLCQKLARLGLHEDVYGFLCSWLQDRNSRVVAGGQCSQAEPLTNSVFQGTVLGPPLWNVHYGDARVTTARKGFLETVFADDYNSWKGYKTNRDDPTQVAAILDDLRAAQGELHAWGRANQVAFDPGKESFHILHRRLHQGDDFKILGVVFDGALRMGAAARAIATEAGWRLQRLLKARRYFTTPELVRLYKAQILSYIESSTPGIYHAAASVLSCVDRVQGRFLREVGLCEVQALSDYKLAPLCSRRDIAMLGALHKLNLGTAPPQMFELFPPAGPPRAISQFPALRRLRQFHNKQIFTHSKYNSTEVMKNSVFGLVHCYNALPQWVVDIPSVKVFQRHLQRALLHFAHTGADDWPKLFSAAWKRFPRTFMDDFFRG